MKDIVVVGVGPVFGLSRCISQSFIYYKWIEKSAIASYSQKK
jgi:hypothetical protein